MEAKERTKEVTEVTFVPKAGLLPGSDIRPPCYAPGYACPQSTSLTPVRLTLQFDASLGQARSTTH